MVMRATRVVKVIMAARMRGQAGKGGASLSVAGRGAGVGDGGIASGERSLRAST